MSWDIFSKSKIQYFLEKLKSKFVQKETGKGLSSNDYTTTDKNKVALIDNATTSATDNPISIADLKSAQIALNPVITFEPIQAGSGTSSPSNIRAISGYDKIEVLSCGKNLFDISKVLVGTVSGNAWTFSGQSGTPKVVDIKFKENTAYTFSGTEKQNAANKNVRLRVIYTDETMVNVFTDVTDTAHTFRFVSDSTKTISYVTETYSSSDSVTITNLQIEEGNVASPVYEPCHKTTDLSESLGQTVYGGSLDVRTGKLVSKQPKKIKANSLSWTYELTNNRFYSNNIADADKSGQYTIAELICSHIPTNNKPLTASGDGICLYSNGKIYLRVWGVTDVTTFINTYGDADICYTVATPTEIQLTPHEIALSQGYAYISTNGTLIQLDYHNGEMARLSDVEQLAETVNELGKKIDVEHTTIGNTVSLNTENTSSTNHYVFPSDGYIYLNSGAVTSGLISIQVYGSNNAVAFCDYMVVTAANQRMGTFVKKGMNCYVSSLTTGASVSFRPLE